MLALLVPRMAKGTDGQLKTGKGEKGTRHVRVMEDLADMIGWIHYFEKTKVAQILDPILRPEIIARYAPYADAVKAFTAAEKQVGDKPSSEKKPRKA